MRTTLRQLVIFGGPLLVGTINLMHPIITPPIYPRVTPHLHLWLHLHLLNLLLFPLLGFAAYLLIQDVRNPAATISRVAIALFVPVYAAFDALAGIGTGTLVSEARGLTGNELAVAERLIDAWWTNDLINALAAAGSIAWVLAMFAATVALTSPDRRRPIAGVVVVLFVVGGWARGHLFLAPDGVTITRAWWLLTLGMAALMFLVGKPRMTGTLLILAGAFFGAYHVPPTGPLGATCFLAAAVVIELEKRKQRKMTSICGAV